MTPSAASRGRVFDRLSEGRWDVLVVGAGIGSRVAYEAALVRPQPMVLAEPAGYPLPVYAASLALYRTIAGLANGRSR